MRLLALIAILPILLTPAFGVSSYEECKLDIERKYMMKSKDDDPVWAEIYFQMYNKALGEYDDYVRSTVTEASDGDCTPAGMPLITYHCDPGQTIQNCVPKECYELRHPKKREMFIARSAKEEFLKRKVKSDCENPAPAEKETIPFVVEENPSKVISSSTTSIGNNSSSAASRSKTQQTKDAVAEKTKAEKKAKEDADKAAREAEKQRQRDEKAKQRDADKAKKEKEKQDKQKKKEADEAEEKATAERYCETKGDGWEVKKELGAWVCKQTAESKKAAKDKQKQDKQDAELRAAQEKQTQKEKEKQEKEAARLKKEQERCDKKQRFLEAYEATPGIWRCRDTQKTRDELAKFAKTCKEGYEAVEADTGWECEITKAGKKAEKEAKKQQEEQAICDTVKRFLEAKKNADGDWECVETAKTKEEKAKIAKTCKKGEEVKEAETGWKCGKTDATLEAEAKAEAQKICDARKRFLEATKNANGAWECAETAKTQEEKAKVQKTCKEGEVAVDAETGWECAPAAQANDTAAENDGTDDKNTERSPETQALFDDLETLKGALIKRLKELKQDQDEEE